MTKPLHVISWALYERCMEIASPRVALDIGANEGGYTKTLLEHGFKVHAFEPVPDMFKKLYSAHVSNPEAILNHVALSDKCGVLENVTVLEAWTLGRAGESKLSVSPSYAGKQPFSVFVWTVDSYLNGRNVGLIKLDVDGYEYRVLKGAFHTIKRDRPPILCELSCYVKAVGDDPEEFVRHIFSMEYCIVSMDGKNVFSYADEVMLQYPHNTSFDVMLIPREKFLLPVQP